MGVPPLSVPTIDDSAFALRYSVLWRTLYPATAPVVELPTPQPASSSAQVCNTLMLVPESSSSTASPNRTAAKRTREVTSGDGIILMDPKQLKEKHALVISTAAADAAERASYRPPPKWKLAKVLVGHQGWVWTTTVDPANAWFATGGFDAVIKVWDMTSGQLKLNLTGHKLGIRGLAVSSQSPYMFSGSDDHSVKCWDLERNEAVREFFGHKSAVHCVATHPTLDVVLSGSRDKTVRVWDIRSRSAAHTLSGHTDSVMCMATQRADPQVITGGSDGMVYLWDLAMGTAITRLTRHKKPVRGVALNVSGTQLVSCGADDIRVWKMPTGEFLCNANTQVDKKGKGIAEDELAYRWSCCAMSPRSVLTVGSQDGDVAYYDWNRPQPVGASDTPFYCPYQLTKSKSIPGTLPGEGGINAVVYDVSGTRMITAESDKSVKVWKLQP